MHELSSDAECIEQWISSNTQLLNLLRQFNRDYSGDIINGTDIFSSLLSAITNAPNLQPLGPYHALRFWTEFLTEDERQDILVHLRDSDTVIQRKGIAGTCALFKHYIPIVGSSLPFAVPVWKLCIEVEWPDGQWRDMVHEMDDDSLYDAFPTLFRKIRIPASAPEPDWEFISTACSYSEGQDVSLDIAKNVCLDISTSFQSFLSTPIFGDDREGTWKYVNDFYCPPPVFFYPIKHANARLARTLVLMDWYLADRNGFPAIIANSVSNPEDSGEYQVCYFSIALLYIARTAIAEITEPVQPQVERISVMAFHISYSGVTRYIFSFHISQPQRIQYWCKRFVFHKPEDLGRLWLELWNSRTLLPHQFRDFPLANWLKSFHAKHRSVPSQCFDLTPPSTSPRVIFSRHHSQCVDPLDQEQRKTRVTWLNSRLREFKYRVDKFIQSNVVRIVHWSSLQVVEYAKFFPPGDSYELSIHHYTLSLPNHPHNRIVPILRLMYDPEGYTVAFLPNMGYPLQVEVPLLPRLSIKRLLQIALQICQTVNFMHQHGVAHLDLKRENILMSSDDRITIIDFSCAFQIPPPPGLIDILVGTPGYMAPEIEEGIPYDPILADIHSLGWVLRYLRFRGFGLFCDMIDSMTATNPVSRPSMPHIISRIESFIAEPSLWEHLDKT